MRRNLIISNLLIVIMVISLVLSGCNGIKVQNINISADEEIYTDANQEKLLNQVEQLKASKEYTIDHPLLIQNPFGTNTTALYVYFKSEVPAMLEYEVHVADEDINDFSRTLYNGEEHNLTTEHEYCLIGLVGGMKNRVILKLHDKTDRIIANTHITIDVPAFSEKSDAFLKKTMGDSKEEISEGLFVTLGHIQTGDEQDKVYKSYIYDNEGVARGEFNLDNYKIDRMLFKNNLLYISTNTNKISALNRLGAAERNYDLGKYELHHDYIFGEDNSMLILASNTEKDSIEDLVISLDLESGEVKELIDLGNLFGEYKNNSLIDEESGKKDWLHINSISLINDSDILLSSRETSTIIKIKDIYNNPQIDYLIGPESFWQGTPYYSYLLTKKGDFLINGGQHDASVVRNDSLSEGQYYIDLFNNNMGYSKSNPTYDWNQLTGINSDYSMYYRYLVDENNRTFELNDELIVDRSDYIGSVQHYHDHLIVNSGNKSTFAEYGSDNKLIAKYEVEQDIWGIYRCCKENFEDFYFYETVEELDELDE